MTDLNLDQLARAEAFSRAREILGDTLPSDIIEAASWIYDGGHVAEPLPPTPNDGLWKPSYADDDTSSTPSIDDFPQVPTPE